MGTPIVGLKIHVDVDVDYCLAKMQQEGKQYMRSTYNC